jgi:hypothetical protein
MSVIVQNTTAQPVPVQVTSISPVAFTTPVKVTDQNVATELSLIPTSTGSTTNHEFAVQYTATLSMTTGAARIYLTQLAGADVSVVYLVNMCNISLTYVSGTAPTGVVAFQFGFNLPTPGVTGSAGVGFMAYNNVNLNQGPMMIMPIPSAAGTTTMQSQTFEITSESTTTAPTITITYSTTANCSMLFQATVLMHPIS